MQRQIVGWVSGFVVAALFLPLAAAEPDNVAKNEITHLIAHLGESGCEFFRNGTWYASPRAVSHLTQKYEYLLKKGLVDTAEMFIDRAASRSSVSGKPYLVKCGEAQAVPSADWLREELRNHRARSSNATRRQ